MKLLGIIIIDSKLNFEDQNLSLCHEASIQLNALIAFEMYGKKNVNYDFFFFLSQFYLPLPMFRTWVFVNQHKEKYRNSLYIKEKHAME